MQPTREIAMSPVRYVYLCGSGHTTHWRVGPLAPPSRCQCGSALRLVWGGIADAAEVSR